MSNKKLVGRTAILAAICSSKIPPSAVFIPGNAKESPYCAHALRSDDLSFTDGFLRSCRYVAGLPDDGSRDEEMVAHVWPFFEDFPQQTFICTGCDTSYVIETRHKIKDNREACKKTAEACA